MRKTWIVTVATLICALTATGCDGGPSGSSSKTTTATIGAAATATAVPAPVPTRPASFSDYASTIASYLTTDPVAAGNNCLAALIADWQMPLITSANGCIAANTDDDADLETIAVITTKLATPTVTTDTQFEIVVFDLAAGAYKVAYQSGPVDVIPPGSTVPIQPIVDAGDLNNDGGGELAYVTGSCGANTCAQSVHILKGSATGYAPLGPPEGITMPSAEARFADTDSDGSKELLLTGGAVGSVGAGPQRPRTETWGWDGAAYVLRSSVPENAAYIYHAVKDADTLFEAGKYAEAEAAYTAVVGDTKLQVWDEAKRERNELEAYSLFRAALALAQAGGDATKVNDYLDRARTYQPQTLHDQLAASFKAGFNAKNSVSVGCAAVRDDIAANLAEYQAFWEFGYANPPFDADAVCPF